MGLKRVLLLAHAVLFHIALGSEVVVQVNTKKWMHYIPERFLSLTVDPLTLAAASPLTQESLNMAKGLSPSFVRLGGIGTNAVYFGKKFMENSTTVSQSQWDSVNEFAQNTGLDIIASLNPTARSDGVWGSQNALELISYSAKKHYGVAWQLGYDMRGYNASGAEVGKDLVKLRKMLDGVTNYANSPVFGPDVTSVNGAKQIHFIKDLITNAGSPLACLILRPNFENDAQPEDPYDLMASMTNELDTYVWNKDVRFGRSIPKKPVWIAESVVSQGSFGEAMKFAKRIGHAARLGVQVYLRQASTFTLKTPTPDFWFSLLYKTLVGQGVLDYKILAQNQTGLHVFTHCTAVVPQDQSVLDTDWHYEKGAVTLFGVNELPVPTKLVLKVTNKEEPIHIYTLTSTRKNISSSNILATLLNGQELKLSPTGELPVLSPKVKKPNKSTSVTIPGNSIYFIVLPDSKVRTCSVAPLSSPDLNLSELTKMLRLSPQRKYDESKEDLEDQVQSEEGVYVSFTKKRSAKGFEPPPKVDISGKTLMRTIISKLAPRKIGMKTEAEQEEIPVKYITFNENSFLNKLTEGVKEDIEGDTAQPGDGKAEDEKSRVEYKYPALASAIKTSKTDKLSETSGKTPKSDAISSAVDDNDKIQVVSIKPLNSGDVDDGRLSRSRRSSKEEPPVERFDNSNPIEIIKSMMEAKQNGTTLSGKMSDIDTDLSHRDVAWKLSPDHPNDPNEIGRSTRQALGQAHVAVKAKLDSEKHNPRNIRHARDSSGEQESGPKTEDVNAEGATEKEIETQTLAKIIEKTEQISSVSEHPGGVLVPEEVPHEQLEDLMLETAKSNSDPEPDGRPSKDYLSTDPTLTGETTSLMEQPAGRTDSVPMLLLPTPEHNIPLILHLGGQNAQGQFNPILVPPQPNPGSMMTKENNIQIVQVINDSNQTNKEKNDVPVLVSHMPSPMPGTRHYNEQKENTINKILKKIVKEEDLALAKMPTEGLKQGMVEEVTPSRVVPIDVEGHTVLIAPDDLTALKQRNSEVRKSGANVKPAVPEVEADPGAKTLVDSGQHLDLVKEVRQDRTSVKVARQVKIDSPITATATPKLATATLAAPMKEPAPTTPSSAASKDISPSSANQLPPLKAPTPEELRERYKVLREKMLELRQQYLEARDKRLEEFRKQVAIARTTPDPEDTIKTIKRREAELKQWFKKFEKREIDPTSPIAKPDLPKPRPRRLSMFTNDENLDMEKFFGDDPVESYNYKRSPDIAPPQQQYLPEPIVPKKAVNVGKLLIPLDSKYPQGIVYKDTIYPARLFGYIDPQTSYGEVGESAVDGRIEIGKCGEYKVRETAEISQPMCRERLAYVPKDAFIKEFKSDFVPVVLLDPEEDPKTTRSKRSVLTQHKRSFLTRPKRSIERVKRSTLTDLEEQFHLVKDEIFPKISSWIKNLSDHPPWKRDLERSSRTRRNVQDFLLTNDLRSLKYRPKALTKPHLNDAPEIEDLILKNIDKGESDVFEVAKKYADLADESLSSDKLEDSTENGYCEEISTSGKSVIRDPFAKKPSKSDPDSIKISNSKRKNMKPSEPHDSESEPSRSLQSSQELMNMQAGQSNKSNDENGETVEEAVFATIVADKIRQFFNNVQTFFGASR